MQLLRYLCVSEEDPNIGLARNDPVYDLICRLRWLVDVLNQRFGQEYTLGQNICIDEMLIAYKGQIYFIQYMKNKPHKLCMKMWAWYSSATGYIYRFELYSGKQDRPQHGLAHDAVLPTVADILQKGHILYCADFYTSGLLGTMTCGTVRINRRGKGWRLRY